MTQDSPIRIIALELDGTLLDSQKRLSAANRAAYDADIALFKPGLREYFLGPGAGHFRLEVTDAAVKMLFYPGAATEPGRVFDLTPGPPPPSKGIILFLQ